MKKLNLIFLIILFGSLGAFAQEGKIDVKVEGKGKAMILIPGLTCHGDVWEETVEKYKSSYKCHILTLPGFAGNPATSYGDSFLETVKTQILDYIKEEKIKNPILVGHSLGGFLSLSIAKDNPGLVSKIVIVDSLPFLPAIMMPGATVASAKPMAENMKNQMLNAPKDQAAANQRVMLASMMNDQEDIERVLEWGMNSDKNTVAQAMYELYQTDLREDLDKIEAPILVLGAWVAYKNYGVTRESTLAGYKAQYAKAPNHKVELTDIGKHFIMYDDPEFFFSEMDKFL